MQVSGLSFLFIGFRLVLAGSAYDNPEQDVLYSQAVLDEGGDLDWSKEKLEQRWGIDWAFSGISTFAHLRHVKCLTEPDEKYDVAIIGAPFDTAVSYRPGARFGPRAIRAASARQIPSRAFNPRALFNPYTTPLTILDCGDIPITPFDNALALEQMTTAYTQLGSRLPALSSPSPPGGFSAAALAWPHPKLITLGGDHSIALAALRGLNKIYKQPVAVVHFDAHLDTWHPERYPGWPSDTHQAYFNHGSMFWMASEEGLILNGSSAHAGLRTRLSGPADWEDDDRQGFLRISADDIDDIGPRGVVERILERVGTETPVYLSIDIDVVDPGLCPGTGTPEPGGWTSREVIRILRGLEGLNIVGADVVEVAPAYDGDGEQTALTAAQVVYEILTSVVERGVRDLADLKGKSTVEEGRKVKDEL